MQHTRLMFATLACATLALAACGGSNNDDTPPPAAIAPPPAPTPAPPPAPLAKVDVKIIAFNDLHGNLEPPKLTISAPNPAGGATIAVPAGGISYMATAINTLKAQNANHAVVSAGDMIGATPLISALFLDEPTIEAVNEIKIDFNAVGNHEFDKGQAELLRMKNGGCAKHTQLEPCIVNKQFPGANFGFLAANTVKADGSTLFPATFVKTFGTGAGAVRVGFIGLTLKNTPSIVTPAGIAGLTFRDEAETANALVPQLKAQGADAIVVVVHEGATTTVGYNDKTCAGLSGDVLPILQKLSAEVDVVVSGHTHRSYVCDYGKVDAAKPFLLTSAGQYGTLVTDIKLTIDPATKKVTAKSADNVIVQGEAFTGSAGVVPVSTLFPQYTKLASVEAIVTKYAAAAAPLAQRVVGKITAAITRTQTPSRESALGNLIADAQLAATRAPAKGGAQIAFMNPGGVRADLTPAANGDVTYGQIFSVQPFGNSLVVKTMTGAQIRTLLEQQFNSGTNTVAAPRVLHPSAGFSYSYDTAQPAGSRITAMQLNGAPVTDTATYRVTMNSFLATGGDNFLAFNLGTSPLGGDLDVDAFEAYLAANAPAAPAGTNRITRIN